MADLLLDAADALATAIDGGHWGIPASATAAAAAAFQVGSDVAARFPAGMKFAAAGTVGNANNGNYVVATGGAIYAGAVTTIPCTAAKQPTTQANETGTLTPRTTFTVERSFLPILELTEAAAGSTVLTVVPVSRKLSGKAVVQADLLVRLFFQQKLPAISDAYGAGDEAATIASLYAFTNAVQLWMRENSLSVGGVSAWCIDPDCDPAHDMKLLSEAREFFACIVAPYRLIGV